MPDPARNESQPAETPSREPRKRIPGWVLVAIMAVIIGTVGLSLYLAVRPDPSLPVMKRGTAPR